jgi:hypothetical protein
MYQPVPIGTNLLVPNVFENYEVQLEEYVEQRKNEMNPNINMYEQFTHKKSQTLLREAEQQRRLAETQPAPPPNWLHHLAARLGGYLVAVGTKLQRAQAVE